MNGLALRDLALVMRVDEIGAAAVDVDRKSKVPVGHRRTFEMPSRAAPSEGTRPGRALRDAPPQSEVELRAPARIVEARVVLRSEDPPHLGLRETRQPAEPGKLRDVEVEAAGCLVGKPLAAQALRLYLLDVHYRRPFDHDEGRLERARKRAKALAESLGRGRLGPIERDASTQDVLAALDDDLHAERAIRALERHALRDLAPDSMASLRTIARKVLGVL